MTSQEIAQMFAAQNSAFMGQAQYASSIGINHPGSGLSAWGTPQSMGAPSMNMPGMRAAPSPFSYAGGGMGSGYGSGTKFAGGVMSAVGAAGSVATSLAFNPFSGAAAGYAAGGIAGGIAGAAIPLGMAYGAGKMIGAFVGGGQQQQQINTQLGQFGFMNPASRTGAGFTRDDATAIGSSIRSLSHIPEMMTSVEELTRMLPKLKGMGIMQGVRDATEFASRFKETIHTIRDVSKMLGSTMEEAAGFFSHSRSVGFLGRQAQLQNVLSTQFTSGQTGMTIGQVQSMQTAGAGMATSMGIKRSVGTTAITNISQMLQKGVDNGRIAQSDLEDLTGQMGPEAMSAASQMLAGKLTQVAQGTSAGRLMMFGLAKFDSGGHFAGIDENMARGLQSGAVGREELMRRAGRLTNQQKMAASGHIGSMSMELAGKVGPGGYGQFLKGVVGASHGQNAAQLLMTKLGFSEVEADITEKMAGQVGTGGEGLQEFSKRQLVENEIRERTDPSKIIARLKTRMSSAIFGGAQESGAKIFGAIGKAFDDHLDDLLGRHVVTLSKKGADSLVKAMSGVGGGSREMKDMFDAAHGTARAGTDSQGIFGDTGFMAMLQGTGGNTGRSASSELARTEKMFGATGDEFDKTGAALNKGIGSIAGASAALQNIISGVDGRGVEGGFSGMTDARKLDVLKGKIRERINNAFSREGVSANEFLATGSTRSLGGDKALESMLGRMGKTEGGAGDASLIRSMLAGKGKFGNADFLTSGIAAAQGGDKGINSIDFQGLASAGGAKQFLDVEYRDHQMKDAEAALHGVINDTATENTLKANPDAGKLVAKALSGDKEFRDLVMSKDRSSAVTELAKKGFNVSQAELSQLQAAITKAGADGSPAARAITDSITTFENVEKGKDFEAIQRATNSTLKDLVASSGSLKGVGKSQIEGVKAALTKFASGDGGDVKGALGELIKTIEANPDKRDEILAASGPLRSALEDAMSEGKGLVGKEMSRAELAKQFNISEGAVASVMGGTGTTRNALTKESISKLEAAAAGAKAGGLVGLGAGKTGVAGGEEISIQKTLQSLNKAIDNNSTIIAGFASGAKPEEIRSMLKGTSEKANVGEKGKADSNKAS